MASFKLVAAIIATLFLGTFHLTAVSAAEPGHDHAGHTHGEVVAYRLADWHEMHFDDSMKAAQHLKAVQDLGCEAKQANHGGHIDIVYRCPQWRQAPVQSHELAAQWLGWLKGAGFDTHHPHVSEMFVRGPETLEIRLADWKSVHMEGPMAGQSRDFTTALQDLGCEVRQENHGGHFDLAFRCPVWITLHMPNHETAETWETWLRSHGFETKHSH